jgi:hypothetical protein
LPIAALVGKPGHKGGNVTTARMAHDVRIRLIKDTQSACTTFFDYYGLASDFVGKQESYRVTDSAQKADIVEKALAAHVLSQTDDTAIRRFIPYVQMYEFEGLLFSEPQKLAKGFNAQDITDELVEIRSNFRTPEEINNSPETAPSKRLLKVVPGYDKPFHGSLAAIEIGLLSMRKECKRFDAWVAALEKLGV